MKEEDEDYSPATRPPGEIPGGKRVRFEREGEYEQSLFGGGAQDIEQSILRSTERNVQIIGHRVVGMGDIVGAAGTGSLQELEFVMDNGKIIKITGIGLHVEIG